ncbi:uncharacterized protein EHS24_007794 [Apiotrichum porosum]|uniref:Uncharacterized protein n=1 Tax=Apiotrichum porosum TaxID=105984 RepID=A0A427XRZ6_9TREE|nr:uncharacterized protein EHS24_007794 [Apiotrichum porosum]RSH81616.1 hypothetical protein EHS24_007794 [Apiotrichum porosum]
MGTGSTPLAQMPPSLPNPASPQSGSGSVSPNGVNPPSQLPTTPATPPVAQTSSSTGATSITAVGATGMGSPMSTSQATGTPVGGSISPSGHTTQTTTVVPMVGAASSSVHVTSATTGGPSAAAGSVQSTVNINPSFAQPSNNNATPSSGICDWERSMRLRQAESLRIRMLHQHCFLATWDMLEMDQPNIYPGKLYDLPSSALAWGTLEFQEKKAAAATRWGPFTQLELDRNLADDMAKEAALKVASTSPFWIKEERSPPEAKKEVLRFRDLPFARPFTKHVDKLEWARTFFKAPPPRGMGQPIVKTNHVVSSTHYLQLLGKSPVIKHDYGLSSGDLSRIHLSLYDEFIPGPHRMCIVDLALRLDKLETPLLKQFLAKIICQHQVSIRFDMRSPSLTHAYLGGKLKSRIVLRRTFLGGRFSGEAKVNAVTALYLVNRVCHSVDRLRIRGGPATAFATRYLETWLFYTVGDTISHDIRRANLGAFVGDVRLTDLVRDMTFETGNHQYDLDLSTLRTCHNLLTAYLKITHHPRSKSVGIPLHLQLQELMRLISIPEAVRMAKEDERFLATLDGEIDVRLLALRIGLAYGALVGLLNDIITETAKRNADREAALAAFTAMASAGAGAGAAIGGPVAEKLVVTSVDGIAMGMTSKLSARHQRQSGALHRVFSSIVDKFNVEVLARADRGAIDNLNPLSLPSDPDIVPLVTPSTAGHNVLRPTRYDIQLFKTTATNVFLSVCSQEGVTLSQESSQPTAAQSTTLERLSEALGSPLPDTPTPDSPPTDLNATALRAEIARHYPPDEREDWYTVIACCAREAAMCSNYPRMRCKPGDTVFSVTPSWRDNVLRFLASHHSAMLYGRHVASGRYENWQLGMTAYLRLAPKVQARDPSSTMTTMVDQVAYFFQEPPCVTFFKQAPVRPFFYDGILWDAIRNW